MALNWGDDRWGYLDSASGAAKGGLISMGSPTGMLLGGILGKNEGSGLRPFGHPKTAAAADPNRFGINRGAKDYAAQTQAALLRSDWDYSRAELEPVLNRLQYMYENPNGEQEAIQGSRTAAGQGFDAGARSTAFEMKRAGLTLTPDQQQSLNQVQTFNRGLATGGAANLGARQYADLKDQIATGSSGLASANTAQPKLKFGQ